MYMKYVMNREKERDDEEMNGNDGGDARQQRAEKTHVMT